MTQAPADAATPVVSAFYDRFPYPGDPLQDGPPPGYNWRWCVDAAVASCSGALPRQHPGGEPLRILDAGCGTGVSTDYLAHLNPGSEILAVDISAGALAVARERLRRSGGGQHSAVRIEQRSLLELQGEGPFDYINSVGVLHHLRQPQAGLASLAALLAYPEKFRGKKVGVIITGGNIDTRLLASVLTRELVREQRLVSLRIIGDDRPGLLATVSAVIGQMGANIVEVAHNRLALDVPAKGAEFDIMIETRDAQHTREIMEVLREKGYPPRALESLAR